MASSPTIEEGTNGTERPDRRYEQEKGSNAATRACPGAMPDHDILPGKGRSRAGENRQQKISLADWIEFASIFGRFSAAGLIPSHSP